MPMNAWRPSNAIRKSPCTYGSLFDAAGLVCVFVFCFTFLSAQISSAMLPTHRSWYIDPAITHHAVFQPRATLEHALKVYLTRDGSTYFGLQRVREEELSGVLRTTYRTGAERKVYFAVDARAKYYDVKVALDRIADGGFHQVTFLVESPLKPHP